MMATKELQIQLEKRLQKQNEEFTSPMRRLHGIKNLNLPPRSGTTLAPIRIASPYPSTEPSPRDAEHPIWKRIRAAEKQRDEALWQLREIEHSSAKTGCEAAAEIVRLRMKTQDMKREVNTAKEEVHVLRRTRTQDMLRQRSAEEAHERLSYASECAMKQKLELEAEVLRAKEEKRQLAEQVEKLESAVTQHIRTKVELQERLMKSRECEVNLREELKNRKSELAMKTFSLHTDDDADDTDDRDLDDLEFSYDGLDLCNLMPFDRAFRLASSGRHKPVELEPAEPELDDQQFQEAVESLEKVILEFTRSLEAEEAEKAKTSPASTAPVTPVAQPIAPESETEHRVETIEAEEATPKSPKSPPRVLSGFAFMSPYASLYKYM